MKLLREPLVHFFAIGAVLFVLFNTVGDRETESVREIRVTRAKIDNLVEIWGKTWQRPPTSEELNGLIEEHIKEEILYREALALGLDQDDTIVRRRLRQKMEFIVEDVASVAEPSDEDLRAYLKEHAESYRRDSLLTFRQVYFNPDRRGEDLETDAKAILAKLIESPNDVDVLNVGDPISLPGSLDDAPEREVARLFGTEFSDRLMKLDIGSWNGSVDSGYGEHIVFIEDRTLGSVPELHEVREAVERDWMSERRRETNNEFYRMLRAKYVVTVESRVGADAVSEEVANAR